jgi:predicted small secreted protein
MRIDQRAGSLIGPLEVKMKKKTLLLGALFLVVLALQGCATLRGMGEDIQSLGRALKRAVPG